MQPPMVDVSQVTVKQYLTGLQITIGALLVGLVIIAGILGGVMYGMLGQAVLQNDELASFLLLLVGTGLWIIMAIAGFVFPGIAYKQSDEELRGLLTGLEIQPDSYADMLDAVLKPLSNDVKGKVMVGYQLRVITSAAMVEGAGMVCAIFYFVTSQPLLLLCVAGTVGLIVYWFPTLTKFRTWLEGLREPRPG